MQRANSVSITVKSLTNLQKILIGCIGIVFLAANIYFILVLEYEISWDFRNNLWGPAHLLVNRLSPYNIHILFDGSNAVWFPFAITLFSFLGLLTAQQASNFWILLNVYVFIAILILLILNLRIKPKSFLPLFLLCLFFPPVFTNFILGQISLLTCLVFLILIFYHDKLPIWLMGLLLVIPLTKPQLGIFFLPAFLMMIWKKDGIKKTVLIATALILCALLLIIPFFSLYPDWIPDFMINLTEKNKDWSQPTLASQLSTILHIEKNIFNVVGILLGEIFTMQLVRTRQPQKALLCSLAITPIFSPYIWTWDFVLLLPLAVQTYFELQQKKAKRIYSLLIVGILSAMIAMKFAGVISDEYYWWLPISCGGIIIICGFLDR